MMQSEIKRLEAEVCYWRGIAEDALAQLKAKQEEINYMDDIHFDECQEHKEKIIKLERELKQKSLN